MLNALERKYIQKPNLAVTQKFSRPKVLKRYLKISIRGKVV
jgi:hypothetical protein